MTKKKVRCRHIPIKYAPVNVKLHGTHHFINCTCVVSLLYCVYVLSTFFHHLLCLCLLRVLACANSPYFVAEKRRRELLFKYINRKRFLTMNRSSQDFAWVAVACLISDINTQLRAEHTTLHNTHAFTHYFPLRSIFKMEFIYPIK